MFSATSSKTENPFFSFGSEAARAGSRAIGGFFFNLSPPSRDPLTLGKCALNRYPRPVAPATGVQQRCSRVITLGSQSRQRPSFTPQCYLWWEITEWSAHVLPPPPRGPPSQVACSPRGRSRRLRCPSAMDDGVHRSSVPPALLSLIALRRRRPGDLDSTCMVTNRVYASVI